MIKLILSNPYDLTVLGANYNVSNLYLGYVKTKGYVLIQENNNIAWFNCIKSDKEPDVLNLNWHWDNEEIKQITEILNNILSKFVPNEQMETIKTEIIGDLLEELSAYFESYDYIKPKTITNDKIKEFALDPIEQFNLYENNEQEPLSNAEFENKRRVITNDIEDGLMNVITLFNDNKSVIGLNRKGNPTSLMTESTFIKIVNGIINDGFRNPLINLQFGLGTERVNRIRAIDYVTDEFNIKGVYKNGKEILYYFNDDLNYFEQLTEERLKNLIVQHLGIKLLKEDYRAIYKSIETTNKIHNNILVFKNMLFDMDYMEELNNPICNYNRREYLAPGLIGYEDKNHKVQLIDYDTDLDFMKLYEIDPNEAEITFVEKTLRQILIPKDSQEDLTMFHDFLQRLGSCILGVNKYKVITLYYGQGNNGKGVLKLLFELIFNNGAYSLTPKTFEESFNLSSFENRKVMLLDEIDKNDFKDMKPTLKRISSPEARVEQRVMYSTDNHILNNFPMLFIFSNDLISIKPNEIALFDRFDFLELPNTFVSEKELNKIPNGYLKDRSTETKIKSDVKGLSWLITASIKMFRNMQNSNSEFILKQTAEQTMDILMDTDYLTKFIRLFTYEDDSLIPNEYTTVEEIYQQFQQYMEMNDHIITDSELTIKRRIGTTIKQVYNIKGKVTESEMYYKQDNRVSSYRIKLKDFEELDNEFKTIFIINENEFKNIHHLEYRTDYKLVYNKIQNEINTINLLNKSLPNQDNYKIVRELLNLNLIIKTSETNLNS